MAKKQQEPEQPEIEQPEATKPEEKLADYKVLHRVKGTIVYLPGSKMKITAAEAKPLLAVGAIREIK